jgi:hypothetical protein
LLAWFFRLPVFLYRVGLAEQLGRSTLLLTTRGRKAGYLDEDPPPPIVALCPLPKAGAT